jgi:ABC-2 type transport system ATP-binding protein
LTVDEPINALPPTLSSLGLRLVEPGRLVFRYGPSRTKLGPLFAAVQQAGFTIRDVTSEETDLEDIFLRLTGSAARKP